MRVTRCLGAIVHAVPGVSVVALCLAVVAVLVVPATLKPSSSGTERSTTTGHGPQPDALASTTTALPAGCTASGTTVSCTFHSSGRDDYTAKTATVTVPSQIPTVSFQLYGAVGGGTSRFAGTGGSVSGTLQMATIARATGSRTLSIVAGGNGRGTTTGGTGGYPDGGSGAGGHQHGSGGGGLTAVTVGGWQSGTVLAAAGGGGGTGGYGTGQTPTDAGNGGTPTGGGGSRGTQTICHAGGSGGGGASQSGNGGGGGGNGCSSGTGGLGGSGHSGGNGGGGNGAAGSGGGGGGGGAGWYGGGGGGGGGTDGSGGGGGGGSSGVHGTGWVTTTSFPSLSTAYATVRLQWTLVGTSTALRSTTGSAPAGSPVVLTATVSSVTSGAGTPSGSVHFTRTGASLTCTGRSTGTLQLSGGQAVCHTAATHSLGSHAYAAAFGATGSFATSTGSSSVSTSSDTTTMTQVTVKTTTTPQYLYLHVRISVASYATSLGTASGTTTKSVVTFHATGASASACTPQHIYGTVKAITVTCRFQGVPGHTYTFTAGYNGHAADTSASTPSGFTYTLAKATPKLELSVTSAAATPNHPVYGQAVTLHVTVTTVPASDSPPATISYVASGGAALTCTAQGQSNPVARTATSGGYDGCTFVPGGEGTEATESVKAVYAGDAQTNGATSNSEAITITPAASTTRITVTPTGGIGAVGVPIVLRATVADATNLPAPVAGTVDFKEGSADTTVPGCAAVPASGGVATCAVATVPSSLASLKFSAVYCATHGAACQDWKTSSSPVVTYTPVKDPTEVVLSPPTNQTNPATATGGQPVTVTADVRTSAGSAPITGTVTFLQNGQAIQATGGGSCTDLTVASTGAVRCTFVPVAGEEDTVTASYTPSASSLTVGSRSAPWYVKVSGQPTFATVSVSGSTPSFHFGVPLTATATVTSGSPAAPVPSGTVAFAVDGSPVASCAAQPVNKTGQATCALPPSTVPAGSDTVSASFAYAGGTYAKSAASTTVTVAAASTSTSLTLGPTGPGTDVLTATVANTETGAQSPPTGTVTVVAGSTSVCAAVPLVPTGGTTAVATCTLSPPATATAYSATYAPADSDFAGSSTSQPTTHGVHFAPGGTCAATFGAVWSDAAGGAGLTVSAGGLGGAGDGIDLTLTRVAGTCVATHPVDFSAGSLHLFGSTLASSSVSGYVAEVQGAGGGLVACLTGGTLSLPSGWSISSLNLSSTEKLCFTLSKVSGADATIGGLAGGSLTFSGVSLPFDPDASVPYTLTLSLTATTTTLSVHLAPTTPPSDTPYATATVTVAKATGTFTASGSLTVANVPFVSAPLRATFSVTAGASGTIAGSISVALKTLSYAPVPGLDLTGLTLTVSSGGVVTLSGTAKVGSGSEQVTVKLAGKYAAHKWSLTATATPVGSWTPLPTLTVDLVLSGSLTVTTAGATPVVTFDFQAGTAPSGGAGGTPLATWTPAAGVTVVVDCVAFAFGATPQCGAGAGSASPTDPTLFLQGSLSFGADSASHGLTAGYMGSIDLKTHAITFSFDPTASTMPIKPVTGLTLTITSLSVSGKPGSLAITGKASAVVAALGSTSFTVSFSDHTGTLVIAGGVSLAGLGVPLTGLLVYASTAVKTYATGEATVGTVDLAKGFNGFAVYRPTAGVIGVLQEVGTDLSPGGAIVLEASWAPGGSPSFSVTLTPGSGFPFLSIPGGGTITAATLSYAATKLSLSISGTIPVPGASSASITLALTIGHGGAFTGTATVTGLTVFGQDIGMVGTLSRATTGAITATISTCQPGKTGCTKGPIKGPFTPFPGVPFTLSTVKFSLGTGGLAVAGTMTVAGLGSLSVTGSFQKFQTWSISVAATAARSWTPVPGVTFSPSFTGTLADAAGTVTFSLVATGAGGAPLFTLSPGGVTLTVSTVGLGDASPPKGCSVKKAGDLWLTVDGSLGLTLAGTSGSVTATGCFDLTAGSLSLTATITNLAFSALTGHLTLGAPTLTISGSSGSYQVAAFATLTVAMPSGGTVVVRATLDFESGGAFVVGAEVNLSQWLGTDGDTAYLYYASKTVSTFATGDPTLQKIKLVQGLTFAMAIALPQSVVTTLDEIHLSLPAGTALVALGTADFATDTYKFKISISLGSGVQLFTTDGTSLDLVTGFLQVVLAPSTVQFGVGLTARLHVPAPSSGDSASTVTLVGLLSVSDTGIDVTLSLGNCSGSTAGWVNAFGDPGLTVKCAALTGGISDEFPFVNVGLDGTITHLPTVIANVTGYQENAPITFAFNLDPFLLSLSIGTKTSTTPALEPLAYFGQGTLIKVYYASIYISPTGATIGSTTFPAGFSLGFQATLFSVKTSILASIGFSPPSITFTATISKITLHGLSIGPVSVVLAASPSKFEFQFTGTATLGPGSAKIGPDLKVGGELSASVQVELSKTGLSAFIWGSLSLTVAVYVATGTCYTDTIWPYPCHYEWESGGFSFTLGKTGFSITSSGITLEADGYSVTFDYDGHVSVSTAAVRSLPGSHPARRHAGHRGLGGVQLVATDQPLTASSATPTAIPVPTTHVHKGTAVLVPTPATPPTASGSATGSSPQGGASPGDAGAGSSSQGTSVGVTPANAGTVVGTWKQGPQPAIGTAFPAVATLHDGDVLVAGGIGTGKTVLASAEVYDPASATWSRAGTLATATAGATATVLDDGDVLIAGGVGAGHAPLKTAELFDPKTGTFSSTGSLSTARGYADAELLADGDVLVVGGTGAGHAPLKTAELYDPKTGTFSPTGSLATARAFPALAELADGDVLVAGGSNATGPLPTAERYDPSTGTWEPAGTMSEARTMAAAATLPDGDVLVVGDGGDGDLYDPLTGRWSTTQGMAVPVSMPDVAVLPGGQVLVVGGVSGGDSTAAAQLYDPTTGAWQDAGSMSAPRSGAAAAVLSNGQVLVAGGGDVTVQDGNPPAIALETSSDVFTGPAGSGAAGSTHPAGVPFTAVISSSDLPVVLGSVGGAVVVAAVVALAEVRRRRRRPIG